MNENNSIDTRNFSIGVLSITAVILLIGLLILNTRPEPAYASGMTASGGQYSMTVGKLSNNEEMLYVIDAVQEKMMTFVFDSGGRRVSPIELIDLAEVRKNVAPPEATPAKNPTGRDRRSPSSRRGGSRSRTPSRRGERP